MAKTVQYDRYGDIDVLQVRDVPRPVPASGEVLVSVKAAGINPVEIGDITIRPTAQS
jgi:NADPH:quinone reductase-like Zn-dependent oxidoreductase